MRVVMYAFWLVFFAAIAWKVWQEWQKHRGGQRVFRIRIAGADEAGVEITGRVPSKLPALVREFVARLQLPLGAEIEARRRPIGFVLVFSANVPDESRRELTLYLMG